MTKKEQIFKYLDMNKNKSKAELVSEIKELFKVTNLSAPVYYSQWITYRKKNGLYRDVEIILRPLDINVTFEEEVKKLKEDDEEFIIALLNDDVENKIEEFWDKFQVGINLLDEQGIPIKVLLN